MSATLRVILAPRAAVDARRLLDEAADLARALDAELAALFVEESALLAAVALPFSVEVGLVSGAVRPADAAATARLLQRRAEQFRALVAETAAALGVPWSFAITRGDLLAEARRAAAAAPVLLPSARRAGPGRARAAVAVLEPDGPGEASERAWDAAARFAGGRPEPPARLAPEDLGRGPVPRLLVVSLASLADRPGLLESVLASAPCPVLLVA